MKLKAFHLFFSKFNCIDWSRNHSQLLSLAYLVEVITPKAALKRLRELSLIYIGQNQ